MSVQVALSPYNGDNRVSNGDFATSADWAFGTGWAHDAVNLEADATASSGTLAGTAAISPEYYYRLKWTIKNYIAGQLSVEAPLATVRLGAAFPATGSSFDFTYHWEQSGVGADIEFNASAFTGSVDDVSVVVMSTVGWRIVDESGTIVSSDYNNSNGYVTYLEEGNTSPELLDPYPEIPKAVVAIPWNALGLAAGCYRLELVDTAETLEDGTASGSLVSVHQSQYFYLTTSHANTIHLQWTNSSKYSVGGGVTLNYEDLSYTQYMRVKAELSQPYAERSGMVYKYANGTRLQAYDKTVVKRILKVDALDEAGHIALMLGLKHDTFKIDGSRAFNDEDEYQPRHRVSSLTSPVDVEVYLQSDQFENRACSAPDSPDYATVIDNGVSTEVPAGESYTCSDILKVYFDSGDASVDVDIDADNANTYTAATQDGSSGTISYSLDTGGGFGSVSLPFTLNSGDVLRVARTGTGAAGFVKINT